MNTRPSLTSRWQAGDRTCARGAIELVLCFRVEVNGALGLRREVSLVSRRFAAVIRAEIEQRLIAFGFVDHCGATLTAAFVQPRSIGFTGKPA